MSMKFLIDGVPSCRILEFWGFEWIREQTTGADDHESQTQNNFCTETLPMSLLCPILITGTRVMLHSRYFFGRTGRIRAVEVRPQKFLANFFRFGRISSIVQPKNLLIWGNFAQIEKNSPEIFGVKLNCADSPISGEKNNYCVEKTYFSW
jgi:hypothetical protein